MRSLLSRLATLFSAAPADAPPDAPVYEAPRGVRMDGAFINHLSGLGMSIDKGQAAVVDLRRPRLAEVEADALCAQDGIAQRLVSILPNDSTRQGWYVRDPSADVDPMEDEDERLDIEARVREGLSLALKYGNGYTFMVCEEEIPEGYTWASWQATPLDPRRLIRVINLINLDTLQATVREYESFEGSPDYGLPSSYTVSVGVSGSDLNGLTVHRSRLIRWVGVPVSPRQRLLSSGRDVSLLQVCLDALRNVTTISQSGANYVQDMGVPVFLSPLLGSNSAGDRASIFSAMMQMMAYGRSTLRMWMLASDEKMERSSASIGGFADLDDNGRATLVAVSGHPMTLLWGSEPGGLSTDDAGGRINWYATVQGWQVTHVRPGLRQLYRVLYQQKAGPTRGKTPVGWRVEFHPLQAMSQKEQLDIQKTASEVDAANLAAGIYTVGDIQRTRYSRRGFRADPPIITPPPAPTTATTPAPGATVSAPAADSAALSGPSPLDALLSVEIPTGDTRSGIGPDGRPWSVVMPADYGEIRGTRGLDGEACDYLLRRSGPRGTAFIVEQLLPPDEDGAERTDSEMEGEDAEPITRGLGEAAPAAPAAGTLDEHKVILGCATEDDARALLQQVYGEAGRWGRIAKVPEDQVIGWIAARAERRDYLPFDGIDFKPPAGVVEELKRGLAWHDEGKSGRGLVPATVAWARRLAKGAAISPKKVRAMRAWLKRHETDKSGEGYTPGEPGFPSPGRVARALWGGDAAVTWSNKLVEQIERAQRG